MTQDKSVRITAASVMQTPLLSSEDPAVVEYAPGYECSINRYDQSGPWQLTILGLLNGLLAQHGKTLLLTIEDGELLDADVVDGAFSVGV